NGGVYNGQYYVATATVNGSASLECVTPTLAYYSGTFVDLAALDAANPNALPGAPSVAGAYTAVASFVGSADYSRSRALANFTITKATPTVSVSDAGGAFNGSAFPATDSVAGVVPEVDLTPANSLEGVSPMLAYYAGTFTNLAALDAANASTL